MNKALQLIFEFKTAPDSLKKLATEYKDIANKIAKKEPALIAAQKEIGDLRVQAVEIEKAFNAELNAWTPKGE